MYSLKQSGMLANKEFKKVLAKAGYFPSQHTAGLFVHKTRPISFTLVVNNFGVKYINKANDLHLEKPSVITAWWNRTGKATNTQELTSTGTTQNAPSSSQWKATSKNPFYNFNMQNQTGTMPLHPNMFHQTTVRNNIWLILTSPTSINSFFINYLPSL